MSTETSKKDDGEVATITRDDGVVVTAEPDIYGQVHPVETPELIKQKLKEFDEAVAKLSKDARVNIDLAQERCPDLLDDAFKLSFLRCDVFYIDLAVQRYASYWDKRVDLFGIDNAFLPLTLDGAFKDDHFTIGIGFAQATGTADPSGRPFCFIDPSRQDRSKHTRESLTRSLWYAFHTILAASEKAQQRGVIVLAYPHHIGIPQLDRAQLKLNMESVKGCLPIRLSCLHVCNPPGFFAYLVFPLVSLFMGERLKKRIRVHAGSSDEVLARLKDPYGITKDMIPSQLGGSIELNLSKWLEERAEEEKEK